MDQTVLPQSEPGSGLPDEPTGRASTAPASGGLAMAPRAGRAAIRTAAARFAKGIAFGLMSPALLMVGAIEGPKAPTDGIAEDWNRVGADIGSVMTKHGR